MTDVPGIASTYVASSRTAYAPLLLPEADNHRARRYVAKYTICPPWPHGLADSVGSVAAANWPT
ncbi:MAG TPA: hypothetical protein VE623_24850 [Acidimicrobiales bacterium]|nr:hypothetical protein [Acidimicrobiales bacterium]